LSFALSVHYNDPSLYVKIEITSANITHKNNYIVYAYVQNLGSATSISSVAVLYYNNSLIFFNNTPSGNLNIPPKSIGLIYASNNTKVNISPGTPVIIEVITSNGVEATYQTNWP